LELLIGAQAWIRPPSTTLTWLPSAHRRMVGPFIFLDSFGPAF